MSGGEKSRFVKPAEACRIFNISRPTLIRWEEQGRIKTYRTGNPTSGHRRIDISSYTATAPNPVSERLAVTAQTVSDPTTPKPTRKGVCYCRVSSLKQRDDLRRQVEHLQSLYPSYTIIKDCGSGLNYKRRGLQRLILSVIKGEIEEVVIAHKDRLCRFGYELLQWLFEQFSTKITVLNQEVHSADTEFTNDLLDIIHVFSCRRNGKRRYKKQEKQDEAEEEDKDSDQGEFSEDVSIPHSDSKESE